MSVTKSIFGYIQDKEITIFTLKNNNGHTIELLNFGGIVHSWTTPDRDGNMGDILLGCETLADYQDRHPYFGAVVGRYANRIAYGRFKIDGYDYQLATNLPPHHLHGGVYGLDRKIWDAEIVTSTPYTSIKLTTFSPDMEEGYPGNLIVTVTYSLDDNNNFLIEYKAVSDKKTHINLTNHSYFDLSCGHDDTILDHQLMVAASQILETDEGLIPTGKFIDLSGTILDYLTAKVISSDFDVSHPMMQNQKGLDHCFVLTDHDIAQPIAELVSRSSGRRLQVFTSEPSIQVYTGNWLNEVRSKNGLLNDYQGICLETQHYPDSPNHSDFPSTLLAPEQIFYSKTIYKVDCI